MPVASDQENLSAEQRTGDDGLSRPVDWDAVRADYVDGPLTVTAVEQKYGITRTQLYWMRDKKGWPRRNAGHASRATLIKRLMKLLEKQIAELEDDMAKPDRTVSDKEVALLGNLTRNLEKLTELDRKERGPGKPARNATEIEALRKKIVARLNELKKG